MESVKNFITDINPDYVVLGETDFYNYEMITKAIRLIDAGARFIATNPDDIERSPFRPTWVLDSVEEIEL